MNNNIVCFGEILWDMLPSGAAAGGAPMNVAYHLSRLGQQPAFVSCMGLDDPGKELLAVIEEKGLKKDFIQIDYDLPTGIVYAEQDSHGDMKYDIVQPVAWDNIALTNELTSLVQQSSYFVFGSLAARNKTSRNTLFSLLEQANTKVLDINLRAPHYNRVIVETLLQKADLLKMNIDELELITGWLTDFKNIEDRINFIQDKFQIPSIIVTCGADGAVMKNHGVLYKHPGIKVTVADTVGSGDSFLAAILTNMIHKKNPADALAYASALGALVASRTGGCPDYSIDDIHDLINNQSKIISSTN